MRELIKNAVRTTNGLTSEQSWSLRCKFRDIPENWLSLLQLSNGIVFQSGDIYGYGSNSICGNLDSDWNLHSGYEVRRLIPIGGDGCGNHYVMIAQSSVDSPVFFTELSENWSVRYIVASSIYKFVEFLSLDAGKEKKWPFDKNYTVGVDIDIDKNNFVKPWDLV